MGTRKKEALERFNRDNIVGAAKELFEKKGIEKTTMDDIAKQADYSKSTIYVYFKSKEDIYNAILKDYVDVLAKELGSFINDEGDFEDCYYQLCECLVGFQEKYPKYYSSLLGETQITNSKKNVSVNSGLFAGLDELIYKLLKLGQKNKLLKKDIELQPTVLYMWSAISGIIQVAERKGEDIDKKLNMNKDEYLRYSFRRFYDSLVGR